MDVNSSQRTPIAQWTNAADEILITGLLFHLREGHRVGGEYSSEIWAQVTNQLNESLIGTDISFLAVGEVKTRYASVRFLYSFSDSRLRCKSTDLVLVEEEPQRVSRIVGKRGLQLGSREWRDPCG